MRWFWAMIIVLLFLAIGRLWVMSPQPATLDDAHRLATCLPEIQIAAGADVDITRLPSEDFRAQPLRVTRSGAEVPAEGAEMLAQLLNDDFQVKFRATEQLTAIAVEAPARSGVADGKAAYKSDRLSVSGGAFQFSGAAALLRAGRPALLISAKPDAPLLFTARDDRSYVIKLDKAVPADGKTWEATIPIGATGVLVDFPSSRQLSLKVAAPASAHALLYAMPPALAPTTQFGDNGATTLVFSQVGTVGDTNGMTACVAARNPDGNKLRTAAPVASVAADQGALSIRLPGAADVASFGVWESFRTLSVAVARADGSYVAYGSLMLANRWHALAIALALTGAMFWLLLAKRSKAKNWTQWLSGLFISDGDNDASLSLFQMFFWTAITVWGFLYVFFFTGNLLSLTKEMMWLLGLAGVGTVGARMIADSRGGSTSQAVPEAVQQGNEFRFWDILNTGGRFDLLKLQLLVFTLVIGLFVVSQIAVNGAFPTIDANTLLLMGVSQGVYLGGKFGGNTPVAKAFEAKHRLELQVARAQTAKQEMDNAAHAVNQLKQEEADLDAKKLQNNPPLNATEVSRLAALPGEIQKATQLHGDLTKGEKTQADQVERFRTDYNSAMKDAGLI